MASKASTNIHFDKSLISETIKVVQTNYNNYATSIISELRKCTISLKVLQITFLYEK